MKSEVCRKVEEIEVDIQNVKKKKWSEVFREKQWKWDIKERKKERAGDRKEDARIGKKEG